MKALSIRQPYAEQIATGKKRIEYRSWTTAYRGPLVIVASLVPDPDANSAERTLPRGRVIAVVELVDVRGSHGDYEWILKSRIRCEPRPVKGKLSLWTIDDWLVVPVAGASLPTSEARTVERAPSRGRGRSTLASAQESEACHRGLPRRARSVGT